MEPSHLVLEITEIVSIVVILVWAGHLVKQLRRQGQALVDLAGKVAQVSMRDDRKIDELLLTQAVMLRRLEQIERRLPSGAH